ncbi:MAG TPA: Dyp-type peroxidase [Oceanospirillales bacterium]|nr:Dyp-type peroxidase [Oceanospirillales bacterium]
MSIQTAILDKSMPHGRFMVFNLKSHCDTDALRSVLSDLKVDKHLIVGLGQKLLAKLAMNIADYRQFPQLDATVDVPVSHGDLFVFIRDMEPGKVAVRSLPIKKQLNICFETVLQVDGFKYLGQVDGYGHDLTGYEDGTENPLGDDARKAVVRDDGSTFVALQQWQHNLSKFNDFTQPHKDNTIGRRLADNEELDDAPASSHVNRADQGTFAIDADILRRSLPWANEHGEGLMFMAFCENLDRFEVQMRRMAGLTDGITDALFTFSQVLNSAYFYCPAVADERLDITLFK